MAAAAALADCMVPRDDARLHRCTPAGAAGALGSRLAPGPEQGRRRYIDPFETAVDLLEMRLDEVEHLRAELIDKEGTAGADDAARRGTNVIADTRRQGRER